MVSARKTQATGMADVLQPILKLLETVQVVDGDVPKIREQNVEVVRH